MEMVSAAVAGAFVTAIALLSVICPRLRQDRAGHGRAECRQRAELSLRALTERSYLTWGPRKMAAVKSVRIKNKFAALQATSISVSLQSLSLLLPRLVNFPCPHNILFKYFK